ncbi:MAG: hypothetical protein IKV79_04510 [Oscillospiraceae bacterium]|nr:hypothetical protein [Oscillospiraceae bacterium]
MKNFLCIFLVIIMVFSLCACGQTEVPADPTPESRPTTLPLPEVTPEATPEPTPEATPAPQEGYIEILPDPTQGIYSGPSYDDSKVGIISFATGYTIMEEVTDYEGNLWGRLKSGAGWVDLTYARSFDGAVPLLIANHADKSQVGKGYREFFPFEDSEYEVLIDIRATAPVTDLELVMLDPFENTVTESYGWVGGLEAGEIMLTKLIFWGDFTTYGVFLTDEDGTRHLYAIGESLRNGEIMVNEIDIIE